MFGRRSLSLPIFPCDLDLERTLRQQRTERNLDLRVPTVEHMAEENRAVLLRDHYVPSTYTPSSCLRLPNITATQYEIKSSTIQMLPSFYGLNNEDPYKHLDEFIDICSTLRLQNFNEDALRMRLFPFSLKDKAKHWLNSLPNDSITSWAQMQQEFLKKYFPIGKTNQIRKAITGFSQIDGESFHETWERMKDLLRKCPHHAVPKWQQVQCFYDGLTEPHRQMVDASCGGTFMLKSEDDAWTLFENLGENSLHHASSGRRAPPAKQKHEGLFEVSHPSEVTSKVDALSRKLDQIMAAGFAPTPVAPISTPHEVCSFCSNPSHQAKDCPIIGQFSEVHPEQVNAAFSRPGNDPYSNSYNPGWRNHPNFSWRAPAPGNQGPIGGLHNQAHPLPPNQSFNQSSNYRPPQHQYQSAPPPPRNSAFEDKVLTALGNLEANTQLLNSHSQSIAKLEGQVGQLANALNQRKEGKLPSQPVANPKGHYMVDGSASDSTPHEQVQAVTTLRSGRVVDNKVGLKAQEKDDSPMNPKPPLDSPNVLKEHTTLETSSEPRAPFPERLKEPPCAAKQGEKFQEMMEIFKQVQINIPIIDAIRQIPSYAKFLKDLCTQKRRMRTRSPEKILLTEQVSSLIQHTVPTKIKDPGAPTISCIIGDHAIEKALLDLGAGVNLLPFSVYTQLGLGELKPTTVVLQLADRSVKKPRGIVEDVIIRVDKFYFPVDFIVLDTEPVPDPTKLIPVILGRPFLATANACINCRTGEMEVTFGNMKVKLNIFNAFQHPSDTEECFFVDKIEETIEDTLPHFLINDPLEACLSHFDVKDFNTEQYVDEVNSLLDIAAAIDFPPWRVPKEPLPLTSGIPPVSSLITPPKLELKQLPAKLKYAFLGLNDTLPVIIAADLQKDQESSLLDVLKEHKEAIGWSVGDLKGIDPSICMHRIHLEDNAKPSREAQRRLNPTMKNVVMNEVVKLLDAGIIYPISDSKWVSPIQVVPKKSGITVVENSVGELIPQRTTTGWRVCIDYRKLNSSTRKDHFPLPFIDQILDRLAGQSYYCFLDGYSGYNQVAVDPQDQEKTTFTCPFGTFAYRRMPFGLCNAPATFQRCMMSIFSTWWRIFWRCSWTISLSLDPHSMNVSLIFHVFLNDVRRQI
jgi:hypothetical protein